MKTYPIEQNSGSTEAFEIENSYIGIHKIRKLLSSFDLVTAIKLKKPFVGDDEFRVQFLYDGSSFVISEPFGDNSRYLIYPEHQEDKEALIKLVFIESIFKDYEPSFVVKIIADIFTLKFIFREQQ